MRHFSLIMIRTAIAGLIITLATLPVTTEPASGQNMMQCMTKCIQHEGGNSATNRSTCKSRCSGASSRQGGKQRDCMAEFKSCRRGCGKTKVGKPNKCYRACKDRQMSCK